MVKQVILARTDLDMSIGRIPAQVAHASIAVFLNMGKWDGDTFSISDVSSDVKHWMQKSFTKVVLKVHSEEELNELELKAKKLQLPTAVIRDDVNRKFEKTAVSIGPADSQVLDMVTGHLKLL